MGSQSTRFLRMPGRACQSGGFTLMELLVSFSLIGLLAVFIHLGYRIGISAREKAEGALERIQTTEGRSGCRQSSNQLDGFLFRTAGARK